MKCEKCGTEKVLMRGMHYNNTFDEKEPYKKENYEHTHTEERLCPKCLLGESKELTEEELKNYLI